MAFVQLIEFETSRIEEMRAIGDEWETAAGGDRKALRRIMCEDRDHPGRYCNIVFFDSYEEAMENSNLPVTQEFSAKMMALGDGPPTFHNLNVLDDRS
jgi:prepilin-type processing-associated H-X9-DG protein